MRSLIILEVEHGEDTDDLIGFADYIGSGITDHQVDVLNWSVRIDLPPYITCESLTTHGLPSDDRPPRPIDYSKGMTDSELGQELIDMDAFDAWLDSTDTLADFYNRVMHEAATA